VIRARRPNRSRGRDRQRGQGLVELALVAPIIIALFVSTAELGLIYGKVNGIGYASREGARTGSALAHGGALDCDGGTDPGGVDAAVVAAVQRILTSPDSGIALPRVEQIRIYRASSTGAEISPSDVNIWQYAPGAGPQVDEVDGLEVRLDFAPVAEPWPACERENGADPDSLGVTVQYRYEYVTPLPVLVNAVSGGNLEMTLSESTVMALNPTVQTR
jgi:hypothetical protein